jgi:hypothetical protein
VREIYENKNVDLPRVIFKVRYLCSRLLILLFTAILPKLLITNKKNTRNKAAGVMQKQEGTSIIKNFNTTIINKNSISVYAGPV